MLRELFVSILLIFSSLLSAQDFLLRDLVGNEVNCEKIAGEESVRISKMDFTEDKDSIYYILNSWQDSCGFSEPNFRVQTLYLIAAHSLADSTLPPDYLDFIYNYLYRLDDAQREDYLSRYEYNKEYYSFVPLRSEFDDWTRAIADSLLENGDYTPLQDYFLKLYSAETRKDFERVLFKEKYDSIAVVSEMRRIRKQEAEDNGRLTLHSGLWEPTGPLSDYWGRTLMLGIDFSGAINDKLRGELGFQFRLPQNKMNFRVNAEDSAQETKSRFSGMIYLGLTTTLIEGRKYHFGIFGSAGLDFTSTDIEILYNDPENGNMTSHFALFSYNFSIGPEFAWKTPSLDELGIRALYSFMNYNSGTRSISNIKGNALSIGLFYRF